MIDRVDDVRAETKEDARHGPWEKNRKQRRRGKHRVGRRPASQSDRARKATARLKGGLADMREGEQRAADRGRDISAELRTEADRRLTPNERNGDSV